MDVVDYFVLVLLRQVAGCTGASLLIDRQRIFFMKLRGLEFVQSITPQQNYQRRSIAGSRMITSI